MTFDPNMWLWLAVAMVPAAVLSGYRLWWYTERDRIRHMRLETFRGTIHIDANTRPSAWEKIGKRLAPVVGTDQQRLLKSLRAAGFNGTGSFTSFIARMVSLSSIVTWSKSAATGTSMKEAKRGRPSGPFSFTACSSSCGV